MIFTPHQYQDEDVQFLLGQRFAGLFLPMGLGKTVISLTAIQMLVDAGFVKSVLLIAPIRTLYTVWPNEIAKWDNFSGLKYHNWHESRVLPKDLPQAHIYGINPESVMPLMKKGEIFKRKWDLLLIDESYMFKNPGSQRFKVIKNVLHHFAYRWILTGTPAPNGLEDIWAQIYLLDRGEALGTYITHFRNDYCVPDRSGYGYDVIPQYKERLYQAISHLVIRRSVTDHIDMPEVVYNTIPVKLNKASMEKYKAMEKEFIALLDSGEVVASPNAAVAGGRCRQIANGGLYLADGTAELIHTDKMVALKEVVEELQGEPLLVFYEFVHDTHRITAALGDVPNLTYSKNPNKLIQEFNEGKHPVMIGHPASIGVGLNLQGACSHILWVGVPWDLLLYDQANARVWRQGQQASRVIIHHIVAEGTLDEKVLKALTVKGREQLDLMEAIQRIRTSRSISAL